MNIDYNLYYVDREQMYRTATDIHNHLKAKKEEEEEKARIEEAGRVRDLLLKASKQIKNAARDGEFYTLVCFNTEAERLALRKAFKNFGVSEGQNDNGHTFVRIEWIVKT